eukprot:scaffold10828_cov36-Phaeocystis_antarctica.AAC.2
MLRLHPEPVLVTALLATHRQLLLGALLLGVRVRVRVRVSCSLARTPRLTLTPTLATTLTLTLTTTLTPTLTLTLTLTLTRRAHLLRGGLSPATGSAGRAQAPQPTAAAQGPRVPAAPPAAQGDG